MAGTSATAHDAQPSLIAALECSAAAAAPVEVLQCNDDPSSIEAGRVVGESTRLAQMREKLATNHILEHHVQILRVLHRAAAAHREADVGNAAPNALNTACHTIGAFLQPGEIRLTREGA